MNSKRVTSGAKLALLGAGLVLLAACGEEAVEPTEEGAAPGVEQPTAATEGEQPAQQQ